MNLLEYVRGEDRLEDVDVKEFTDNEHCAAHLDIESDVYNAMYFYEGFGEGGEEAKKYLDALNSGAKDHNMWYNWGCGGAILYDNDDLDAGIVGKMLS